MEKDQYNVKYLKAHVGVKSGLFWWGTQNDLDFMRRVTSGLWTLIYFNIISMLLLPAAILYISQTLNENGRLICAFPHSGFTAFCKRTFILNLSTASSSQASVLFYFLLWPFCFRRLASVPAEQIQVDPGAVHGNGFTFWFKSESGNLQFEVRLKRREICGLCLSPSEKPPEL